MRIALTAFLVLFMHGAFAAEMYPVTDADRKFLAEIIGALQPKDSGWIAGHMVYPLSVGITNRTHIVKLKGEFAAILSRELTDSVRAKIANAAKGPLFKNWQGVMVGEGALWFSQYKNKGDTSWTYGIFAIGGFAFQPTWILVEPNRRSISVAKSGTGRR